MKKNLLLLFACMVFAATSFAQTGGACGENLTWTLDETTGTLTISGEGEMKDFGVGLAPWHKNRASITNLNIESGVTSIGWGAFAQCSEIVSVNLPEGLTTIGEDSFYECLKLSAVDIPNSVTSIGDLAFFKCTGLTSITIPEDVTTIGWEAFTGCEKLEVINLMPSIVLPQDHPMSMIIEYLPNVLKFRRSTSEIR